jgi:hypothetical protein
MNIMPQKIRQLFFILLFLGLFLMTLRPISDPDFWWHLQTGQLIAQTGSIPHVDPYSFTRLGDPWVAHEWLSELLIFGLYKLGGFGFLILVFSLVITGAFLLAYLRSPRESRPYVAGCVVLLGAIATAPTWGVRPQMLSLLMTSVVLYLFDRFKVEGNLRLLVPLPLIMLVWVNLHAGYFLGLAILAIYLFGGLIDLLIINLRGPGRSDLSSLRYILMLFGTLVVCLFATLANPNGFSILIYPFQTLISPAMQQFIQEWFSPDFHLLEWQPLAIFFLTLVGVGMLGKKQISPTRIILTVVFGYAALRSMRNIPLFVIVAIPALAEQIDSLVRIPVETNSPNRLRKALVPTLLVFFFIIVGFRFWQVVQTQPKAEAETFPRGAVDWIVKNHPHGQLFNTYGWGGYLIWRLYPIYPVYIDGRADVYGDKFLYAYTDIYRGRPGWEQALDAQAVHLVLVEPESGLASNLKQSPNWEIAYQDQISVVFDKK